METATVTEALLRRERAVVLAALFAIAALAWAYIVTGAGTGMSVRAMTRLALAPGAFDGRGTSAPLHWTTSYWLIMVAMWWVMMIAMMTPGAGPMILLYARATRFAQQTGQLTSGVVPTAAFAGGYLIIWLAFSVLAAALMFSLEQVGLMSSMMMWSLDPWLSAAIFLAAGLYQLTPIKTTCLRHCRSPVQFLSGHWRPGRSGAVIMGINHGAFCVGCCWALMALLFVGGIMNLLWIAGLATFVLMEKVVPRGEWLARAGGVACIACGFWIGVRAAGLS